MEIPSSIVFTGSKGMASKPRLVRTADWDYPGIRATRSVEPKPIKIKDRLEPRQRKLLDALIAGRTLKEAAADLSIGYATSKTYLADARTTTGCRTTVHLVARYLKKELE